jgi:hypothetical protein
LLFGSTCRITEHASVPVREYNKANLYFVVYRQLLEGV